MRGWLDPLRSALDVAPAPVPVFFRDDDAGWRDDRLLALLDVFDRHGVPVDVAAIPAALSRGLAAELLARGARVHQHGWAHVDHEPAGRRCEFGPSRPRAAQLEDIAAGAARLEELLGPHVEPIFTPPWNRCTEVTAECLAELGFACLSRESRAAELDGIAELPVHVDWFAHRRGARLARPELGARLAAQASEGGPLGVMLHHAVMDVDELAALDELVALVAAHDAARFVPMTDIVLTGATV
jgi:peptidoglycan/xylan/chitin deacetylase (PgdA/CDA1 family)